MPWVMHRASKRVRPPSCATFLVARSRTAGSVSALEQALARTLDAHWRCWGLALPVTKGGLGRTGLITARVKRSGGKPKSAIRGLRGARARLSQTPKKREFQPSCLQSILCFLQDPPVLSGETVWLRFG